MTGLLRAYGLEKWPWQSRRWLVLAPHADDETLGAGALIGHVAGIGRFAGLVYLTDGSGSHELLDGKAGKLITARKQEARTALRRLTASRMSDPLFLDWRDAAPPLPGNPHFEKSCRTLAVLCARLRVDVLATTALQEPHCDHAAAAKLAYAVQAAAKRPLTVAEFVVWGAPPSIKSHRRIVSRPMLAGTRRHALAAHRSQLTASHGPGFRLAKDKRTMPARDILYVRKR